MQIRCMERASLHDLGGGSGAKKTQGEGKPKGGLNVENGQGKREFPSSGRVVGRTSPTRELRVMNT